jgi:hypothetical protein
MPSMDSMYPPHDWAEHYWPADWWPDILTSSNSQRWKIVNAVLIALSASTGIASVTNKLESWWDFNPSQFPHIQVLENAEKKKRFSYPNANDKDMYSELELNIEGFVFDMQNSLDVKRTDLIRDIELAVTSSTEVKDVTADIVNVSVETDRGTLDNYGIVHSKFLVKYVYNHGTP